MGLLVLGRKANEEVELRMGDITIRIIVAEFRRGRVRLAFDAPPEVVISRPDAKHKPETVEEAG